MSIEPRLSVRRAFRSLLPVLPEPALAVLVMPRQRRFLHWPPLATKHYTTDIGLSTPTPDVSKRPVKRLFIELSSDSDEESKLGTQDKRQNFLETDKIQTPSDFTSPDSGTPLAIPQLISDSSPSLSEQQVTRSPVARQTNLSDFFTRWKPGEKEAYLARESAKTAARIENEKDGVQAEKMAALRRKRHLAAVRQERKRQRDRDRKAKEVSGASSAREQPTRTLIAKLNGSSQGVVQAKAKRANEVDHTCPVPVIN
ncbi:hypothetical protein FISHEDRAFT_62085 [Fistulina hepatica ATCC 64428]|nr:hypothetical protein FISHEDRAFT_62085 [Fistulina hepatica ATCC 64428]